MGTAILKMKDSAPIINIRPDEAILARKKAVEEEALK